MSKKIVPFKFTDVVRYICRETGDDNFEVTFYEHAAVYNINPQKKELLDILTRSEKEELEVKIVHNMLTSEILEVNLTK